VPEVFVFLAVTVMLVIMMILVLLGMLVAGFEVMIGVAMRVVGISLLVVCSNEVVDGCWTWSGSMR
jgi:hypothetical protein